VPCGPVHDYEHLFADPQVVHNRLVKKLSHSSLKTIQIVGNPLFFSKTPAIEKRASPLLGEDTGEILKHFGYADEEIRYLRMNKIL
jgi:crotonobetainyl-CoA:carnitine CoA-transferase CaiB-like acyl-CoA transferase